MKLFFLMILASATFFRCHKEDEIKDEYVTLAYSETQCSDVWTRGSTDSITRVNLTNYLNTQNIYAANIDIRQETNGAFCAACTCPTGKVIRVTTLQSNLIIQKLNALGFK